MFSATDLIEALRKRARRSLRPERPAGEFPEGWSRWFQAMAERAGRITGASADAIIAIFLQREPALPPRSAAELDRWRAFATLWRQQWQAPEREERRARLLALALTLGIHVLLLLLLLWLAYVHVALPAPDAGEDVVQVEFVGEGTVRDPGGGGPATPSESAPSPTHATVARTTPPARPSAAQPGASAAAAASATPPAEVAPLPATPIPPQPPAPTVEQPLQVTERSAPDATFVLPPPTPRQAEVKPLQLPRPSLQAPLQAVELIQAPPPVRPLEATIPERAAAAPRLTAEPIPIEVIEPLPKVQARVLPEPALPAAQVRQAVAAVPLRAAPAPAPVPAPAATTAAAATSAAAAPSPAGTAATSTPAQAADSAAAAPTSPAGSRPATAPGQGPATAATPGAWPSPRRGDDWGDSTRNRPGGNPGAGPGLFNADGSPRVASGSDTQGSGFPPGSDHWTREQLDRAGTWLKRPPNDYTPTRFDQYWVPSGTLLEEWVRKGIREIAIPIPGTSKKIQCVISILQFGGGCGISDPNLNDQEAIARPPPDVPFKPDLQEDQDSLRKPGAP